MAETEDKNVDEMERKPKGFRDLHPYLVQQGVFLLLFGVIIGVGSFWVGMNLLNKSFTECYARGGVVKLPLAASGGAEGRDTPVWGYFTTVFGKQHYLLSLGLSEEGPEFDSYYREPLVIMGKKEFKKIVDKAITTKLKAKK